MSASDEARQRIGEIAGRLLGEPNRALSTRMQLRFGTNGSIAVEIAGDKRGSWFDHENGFGGGPLDLIREKLGLVNSDAFDWLRHELGIGDEPRKPNGKDEIGDFECAYDYRDEAGELLFQVVRYKNPKTFRQRRLGVDGRWEWKAKGTRQVLYRLPELVAAPIDKTVFVIEGEKDVDNLVKIGLVATCNPGGAVKRGDDGKPARQKWRDEYNPFFHGRDVVILPDNDVAGHDLAHTIEANLRPIAARVRVLNLPGLEEKGDVTNWLRAGGTREKLQTLVDEAQQSSSDAREADATDKITVYNAGDIDPKKIPPRGWLVGTTFCRKFISGLIGAGTAGKTTVRYAQLLGAATKRNLTGEHVHVRCRVLIVCLEDDLNEVKRRISAAMLHHKIDPAEVDGWLYYCCPRGLKLLQASTDGGRAPIIGALYTELRTICKELSIDLLSIDPFVKAHGVEENDNNLIDQVCILLADLGDELDLAVDINSHARKGLAIPGDVERDRGASAKKDAGRLMRTVAGMSTDEAELFGIAPKDQPLYIRVDDAKVNITLHSTEAMWFKLVGVPIGNTEVNPTYPNGDNVQTVERWYPPDAFAKLDMSTATRILNKIEEGPYEGGKYSPAANAKDRAAWPVIQEFCLEFTDKQAKHVIKTWIKNGVLVKRDHKNPKDSHDHPSLFVGKRPGNTWES
jgi:5S rRNA maturation endonuclease (ribonuclease M5)